METPSPSEARAALDSVAHARAQLAPYVTSPWWFYPVQGIGIAALVLGLVHVTVDQAWGTAALLLVIVIFCTLPFAQRLTGRPTFDIYTHRGSRGPAAVYAAVVGLLIAGALVVFALLDLTWPAYLFAAAGLIVTIVAGPLLDARLARAVRDGR